MWSDAFVVAKNLPNLIGEIRRRARHRGAVVERAQALLAASGGRGSTEQERDAAAIWLVEGLLDEGGRVR